MNLELSKRAIAGVTVFFVVSIVLLLYMLARLGTLPVPGAHEHSVRVTFADAEGLPVQADVLVHGVKVGSVSGISVKPTGRSVVTLKLGSGAPVLHPDASADVGFKTPLGEPFVDLDPGHARGRLTGQLGARSAVEIDDALAFLDAGGRANLRAVLGSLGRGAASPDTSSEVNGTLAQLSTTTTSLGTLTAELSAQRGDLTAIVSNGRTVLDVLAGRAAEIRGLTDDAGTALSAAASQRAALGSILDQLPGLETLASSTLLAARPLIARATPVVEQVAAAAPALTRALDALPETTTELDAVLSQAPAIRSKVLPALSLLHGLAGPGTTALSVLGPALADIIPMAQYLEPRGNTIAAWFSNTADLGSHGDAKGDWARFFVMFDPSTLTGSTSGAPAGNSYTLPNDAAHNQAYVPGDYPHLMAYSPALGK
jgi:phospholipid/cholesterol/gamma-HCH transport system substrate-binding protein